MTTIWEISGDLVAESPLHIGATSEGSTANAVMLTDGKGRYVVPGTSLAGVLRARLGAVNPAVWGDVADSTATTSAVTIFDAWVEPKKWDNPNDPAGRTERTTTSIDRATGAPARHHLFRREYLSKGTTFRFRAIVEGPDDTGILEAEAKRIAAVVRDGIDVGASTSSGYGRLRSRNTTIVRKMLTRANLLQSLGRGKQIQFDNVVVERPMLSITAPVTAAGALFVSDEDDGGVIKQFPLTTRDGGNIRFLIPGSSVKGVLRSHAETIVRTVTGTDTPVPESHPDARERFLLQLADCGLPAVTDLFGTAADDDSAGRPGNRGAIRVNDLVSDVAVPSDQWNNVLNAAGEEAARAQVRKLNATLNPNGASLVLAVRNSIDRFSGGTVDTKLFTSLEPHVPWQAITLQVDLAHLERVTSTTDPDGDSDDPDARKAIPNPDRRDAALALLLFVLIDLCEGWIRFGAETTRGAGAVKADRSTIVLDVPAESVASGLNGSLDQILDDPDLLDALTAAWLHELDEAAARRSAQEETHV